MLQASLAGLTRFSQMEREEKERERSENTVPTFYACCAPNTEHQSEQGHTELGQEADGA